MFNGSTSLGDADGIDQRLTACPGEAEYSTLRRSDPPPPPPFPLRGYRIGSRDRGRCEDHPPGSCRCVGVAVGVVWREIIHPVGRLRFTANTSSLTRSLHDRRELLEQSLPSLPVPTSSEYESEVKKSIQKPNVSRSRLLRLPVSDPPNPIPLSAGSPRSIFPLLIPDPRNVIYKKKSWFLFWLLFLFFFGQVYLIF